MSDSNFQVTFMQVKSDGQQLTIILLHHYNPLYIIVLYFSCVCMAPKKTMVTMKRSPLRPVINPIIIHADITHPINRPFRCEYPYLPT